MKKKILSLALALCMALALLPTTVLAADSDFTISNGALTKYTGDGGDVVIPDGVTSIGGWAFRDCTNLTSVTIPDSVTSIGWGAFSFCTSLTSVTIPNSVTSIGISAFEGSTGLTSVTIPNSVTSIQDLAFYGCTGLTSVTIPNSVTSIGYSAFYGCTSLTSVTIPNSVTSIGSIAFKGCTGLTSVTIPNSVTSIGERAFSGTGLTSVTIPDGITNIEFGTFGDCPNLTNVTIPSSVTSIDSYAFGDCPNLTDVYYTGSEAQWKSIDIDESENKNDDLLTATIHYNGSAEPEQPTTVGGFSDVHEGDFYDSAVLWAVDNGITNGTSGTTFSPNSSCSRAQIVTFLYRAMNGEPVNGSSNPFTDITGSGEIYDAIQWARANGITSGTTTTTFSPNVTCSRAQVVTFLWRALDRPEPESTSNDFTDVPSDGDIGTAIQWAVEKGITSGTTKTTFSPNEDCSRAQVVTFLYRALVTN